MTTTHPQRDRLYAKLRQVLGNDDASTLITLLPQERDHLATKDDIGGARKAIDELKSDLHDVAGRMDRLEEHMERFDARLWDFHAALRSQTRVFATITVTAMLGIGSLAVGAAALL